MIFENPPLEENEKRQEDMTRRFKDSFGSLLRVLGLDEASLKGRAAEISRQKLADAIDSSEKLRYVDLNKPLIWKEEKVTRNYSIDKLRLVIDEVRESLPRLRELVAFIDPEFKKDAEELLLATDIYLAAHDEKKEEAQREIRSIRFKQGLSTEEMARLSLEQGLEFIDQDREQLLDMHLPTDKVAKDENRFIARKKKSVENSEGK